MEVREVDGSRWKFSEVNWNLMEVDGSVWKLMEVLGSQWK